MRNVFYALLFCAPACCLAWSQTLVQNAGDVVVFSSFVPNVPRPMFKFFGRTYSARSRDEHEDLSKAIIHELDASGYKTLNNEASVIYDTDVIFEGRASEFFGEIDKIKKNAAEKRNFSNYNPAALVTGAAVCAIGLCNANVLNSTLGGGWTDRQVRIPDLPEMKDKNAKVYAIEVCDETTCAYTIAISDKGSVDFSKLHDVMNTIGVKMALALD